MASPREVQMTSAKASLWIIAFVVVVAWAILDGMGLLPKSLAFLQGAL